MYDDEQNILQLNSRESRKNIFDLIQLWLIAIDIRHNLNILFCIFVKRINEMLYLFLDRITMEFVNQYWPFFVREMMPQARETMEPVLIEEANKFLLHVPIRKMLYYGGEDSA